MAKASEIMSKRDDSLTQPSIAWGEFIDDILPMDDIQIAYDGHEYMLQQLGSEGWSIVEGFENADTFHPVFIGPKDMAEFTNAPVPLFGGKSLREAWPDIVFVSA